MPISEYLTVSEAADSLRVSVATVRRAIRRGDLDVHRVGSKGLIRITPIALRAYATREKRVSYTIPRAVARRVRERAIGWPVPDVTEGNGWKIINADATEGVNLLEDESVACVVTSPPYYWQRDYEVAGQIGHEASIAGYVDALRRVFAAVWPKLREDGTVFLNLGDTYYSAKGKPHGRDGKHARRNVARQFLRAVDAPGMGIPRKSLIGIPWRVALALQADGWTLRSTIIWARPGSLPEPSAQDRPWRTFEYVFMLSKSVKYWFSRDTLAGSEDMWLIRARPDNPDSHAAPYPVHLVERCLTIGCRPSGLVLDPFMGSGTTAIAAMRMGLPSVGIELNSTFCRQAAQRIRTEATTQHLPLNSRIASTRPGRSDISSRKHAR